VTAREHALLLVRAPEPADPPRPDTAQGGGDDHHEQAGGRLVEGAERAVPQRQYDVLFLVSF
jgi:hypothetical protein